MKRASPKSDSATIKRTRRGGGDEDELTLEQHIAKKRAELVQRRQEAPQLLERAARLQEEASAMAHQRWRRRHGADLLLEASQLRREAETRLSMSREHHFEDRVVSYIRTYYATSATKGGSGRRQTSEETARTADAVVKQRDRIVDEYLLEIGDAPPRVAMSARDECPRCPGQHNLVLCNETSTMTCPQCGYVVTYLDATSASTSFDEVIDYSPYSYKRINHFLQWLSLLQGKEAHVVPDAILNAVMDDLYTRVRLRRAEDVTQKQVRESLRRLRLRKAYDHVAQITARLSGVRPPRVGPEVEEKLRTMFLRMQPAFQRHAPSTRTNFLSYSYVLYRCFQILNMPHVLPGLTLLKGRDKLENNDRIFRLMCTDLGWHCPDLPPASETVL